MHFPVSGVYCAVWIPPLVAFVISSLTASAGVSGAFLLLPFQMSVLGFTSPSVSPTNLIYNIVAIPGGVYRYIKEGRMAWPLTWTVVSGTLPGVVVGAIIRIRYFPDPRSFKLFVGLVLLLLGIKILLEFIKPPSKTHPDRETIEKKFQAEVSRARNGGTLRAGLSKDAVIRTRSISWRKIEYEFWNESFAFNPIAVFSLALAVGLVGGVYGIGGGAIIAPFVVAVLAMPVYVVAGAALSGTLITSVAGVACFELLALTPLAQGQVVRPDWALGTLFGVGGLFGTYLGARIQKFIPERLIRLLLAGLSMMLAVQYIGQFLWI
ncbi:MAG: sulfite exporter TauE/SafE family protein [Deltaproteobacteria bacterium]|nr:sulfite exporter TauE/SafE family protein [Deltaproteobacteria bacterium]